MRLAEDRFQVATDGDIGLDEKTILGEGFPERRAVHTDDAPTQRGEVMDCGATYPASSPGDQDGARSG